MSTIHEMLDTFNLEELPIDDGGNPDIPKLKRHIKLVLLQNHPDKGGDRDYFEHIHKIGKKLLSIFNRTASQKYYSGSMDELDAEQSQLVHGSGINLRGMNEKKFNELWENKIGNLNNALHERGYSDKFGSDDVYDHMQITRSEPMGGGGDDTFGMVFEKIGDRSNNFNGDGYSDLMEAYAEPNREAIRSTRIKNDYGSVGKLKMERGQLKLASREEMIADAKRRDAIKKKEDAQRMMRHKMHMEELVNISNGFLRIGGGRI